VTTSIRFSDLLPYRVSFACLCVRVRVSVFLCVYVCPRLSVNIVPSLLSPLIVSRTVHSVCLFSGVCLSVRMLGYANVQSVVRARTAKTSLKSYS